MVHSCTRSPVQKEFPKQMAYDTEYNGESLIEVAENYSWFSAQTQL